MSLTKLTQSPNPPVGPRDQRRYPSINEVNRLIDEIEGGTVEMTTLTLSGDLTVEGTTTLNGNLVLGDAAADSLTVNATTTYEGPINYSLATGLTAFAGGGQASATALTEEINNVMTVATAGDSVKLAAAVAGKHQWVKNSGATALDIFPATGDSIDALAVNLAIRIMPGSTVHFYAKDATVWESSVDASLTLVAPTTNTGGIQLLAAASAGNFMTTITNASQAAARTYTIPDAGGNASFLMSGGTNPYSSTTGITAFATGGQAGATALTTEYNEVTVCATAGDSVKLPAAAVGLYVTVKNNGAAALDIFPATGDSINALAVNLAVRIYPGSTASFRAVDATVWESSADSSITIVSPTTNTGQIRLLAAASAGNFAATITNASMAADRTLTIPDPGAAASFVMTEGAQTVNGTKTFGGDISFVQEVEHTISIAASTTAATAGANLNIVSGLGNGAASGDIVVRSANETGTDASGAVTFTSGTTESAASGAVGISSGAVATLGNSGDVTINSGDSTTSGNSGATKLVTGNATAGDSGIIALQVGTASGTRGHIEMYSDLTHWHSDTAGTQGPTLASEHDVVGVSGNKVLTIKGTGQNDLGATQDYAQIDLVIRDPNNAGEDGRIDFKCADDGTLADVVSMIHTGANAVLSVGDGAATAIVQSQGNFDLQLQTGNGTTGTLTMTDGANGNLTWTPNGTGRFSTPGANGVAYSGSLTASGATTAVALNTMVGTVTVTGVGDIAADGTANAVINNSLVTASTVGMVVMQTTTAAAGSTPRIETITYGAGTITIAIRNSDSATATGAGADYSFSFQLFQL